jgi:LacI family repressor for deo operon, udp, cdd, tsx, nupC, and nupG
MADIRDVAKRAGVHISTVSRVLSHPGIVAPATRQRVLRAIKALAYTPNSIAAGLRTRRSGKILVITPDLSNAIFPMVLGGIEDAANRAGYAVLLGYTNWGDKAREERYVKMMTNSEADGLIFMSPQIPKAATTLVRNAMAGRRAPVVNVLSCDPAAGIPSVHIDNEKAAYHALDYLYGLGHRRVALITGPPDSTIVRDRMRGALTRAREAGVKGKLPSAHGELSIEAGRLAAEQLLAQRPLPTAIFCTKDEMAIGALECARRRGFRVPHDLSIVGFDDIPFAQHTDPALTTMSQPMCEIGQTAVKLLLDITERNAPVPASVVLPHQLSVRASTAPPPPR